MKNLLFLGASLGVGRSDYNYFDRLERVTDEVIDVYRSH